MKRTETRKKAHDINLVRKIRHEGIPVFRNSWNSGHSGVGAGTEYIFEMDGRYAVASSEHDEVHGPYDDLETLFDENGHLLTVTTATEAIECIYLEADSLSRMLSFWTPAPDPDFERLLPMLSSMNVPRREPRFTLNGEPWVFTKQGGFRRVGHEIGEDIKVLH